MPDMGESEQYPRFPLYVLLYKIYYCKGVCKMYEAKLSSKNQIVIPRGARKPLGLKPADKLLVVVRGDMIILMRKPKKYSEALRGAGQIPYQDMYLERERESWK